jgi:hypothetical protein
MPHPHLLQTAQDHYKKKTEYDKKTPDIYLERLLGIVSRNSASARLDTV